MIKMCLKLINKTNNCIKNPYFVTSATDFQYRRCYGMDGPLTIAWLKSGLTPEEACRADLWNR